MPLTRASAVAVQARKAPATRAKAVPDSGDTRREAMIEAVSESSRSRRRMTGAERREQLIQIGRALFAEKGFDGTSVEEIAASAKVSKPVVYEHFGGKEGIYAVVIDREMQRLLSLVTQALSATHALVKLERAALALLQYIEESSEGFRILVRDSHAASGTGTFASLISDIASQVEDVLADEFKDRGYDPKLAPMYAQMLVGMTALTGQWWLDVRKPRREEVAAHLVNLSWNGLTGLNPNPGLTAASRGLVLAPSAEARTARPTERELKELEKARERELKEQEKIRREQEKARERELREQEKARERELKEQQKAQREQEKLRERELKEQEKARERQERELRERRERELKEQDKQREREERERQSAAPEQVETGSDRAN
ncbi:TetR family transcriptional regulator [Planotetraspora sp. A-T 1434]|uniref:TetR/AcrR family transcriptional regulator n=1 Tax=Planotetraspora sp. A-T 1434 TaxID=2979219 RepID=UPI0021BFBEDB|nr:TetR family transcriptional regulator [Planotetraspora sp. A-T 1434]MCT9931554.1 TetR family transcriptional regulator [Planotetraspora sp. A-T 1434]